VVTGWRAAKDAPADRGEAARVEWQETPSLRLVAYGDWTVSLLSGVAEQIGARPIRGAELDVSQIGEIDTAGAFALARLTGGVASLRCTGREDLVRLAALIDRSGEMEPPPRSGPSGLFGFFVRTGERVETLWHEAYGSMVFAGRLTLTLGHTLAAPRRLRLTPLFAMMEAVGVNALPIVFTMTFFIGAVIALVGANLLTTLGVSVFTVELVGVAILREFGVVIAAILLAGRSASSFAAELGSMRMNQETHAMQVMGVDRFHALVVPRVLAALLMMPILTFVADIGGLVGGLLVSWITMDLSPTFFISRLIETVELRHFWIGMSKAPFLALLIAAIGCRQGLLVEGDTQSLGRHVTAAVVHAIFLIIMFDAIFAVIFMVLDL
jgi:phospholipid/cholesterol/gamma-HCH transport system permease protein